MATEKGRRNKLHFEVVPDGEIRIAPVVGDIYEQVWTSIEVAPST